jgi:hypothetical protein
MPWNPNNASRQFQQQAQQQAQNAYLRNQQYAAQQMNAQMAQNRAQRAMGQQKLMRQQPDDMSAKPTNAFAKPERGALKSRRHSNATIILDIAIVAMVLVAIAVASSLAYRAFSRGSLLLPARGGGAVAGSVRTGSNVRQGPGTTFPVVTVLQSGSHVTVSCIDAGWARLESPYAGRYIASWLLALTENPKTC